jgi:hypothetical protein
MTTHTPGPWMLGKSCDGFLTVTDGSKTICTVGEADLFPEIELDAHLIAAAPQLLKALRTLLFNVEHGNGAAAWEESKEEARFAIASAEGGEL